MPNINTVRFSSLGWESLEIGNRPPVQPFAEMNNNIQQEGEIMSTVGSLSGHEPDITSLVTHPMIVGTGKVGIEVELENVQHARMTYWNAISDHSLRNSGVEFVMKQPLGGRDLQQAIFELDTTLYSMEPDASWRCSTHIHLDVRDMTVPQLKKFILTYTALERIIFQCSGLQRWDNVFCPSFGFAQGQISKLSRLWNRNDRDFLRGLDTSESYRDRDKYSSLNFLPIRRQGSVEFRGSEAKFRKGQLLRLANRTLSIREFALSFEGSEVDLVNHISNTHPSKVLKKSMPSKFAYDEGDIMKGCDLAMDIIHLHEISGTRIDTEVTVRTRWAEAWRERFNSNKPRTISAITLINMCRDENCWVGDFCHTSDFSKLQQFAADNSITL